MKVAIVAPSPVPFVTGGAENIYAGLFHALNQSGVHQGELIKLPTRELSFWALIDSYYAFASLDLDHFDAVISMKYPAWMVHHPRHIVYMQHKLRGFYDTWRGSGVPGRQVMEQPAVAALWKYMARAETRDVPRTEALLHLRMLLDRLRSNGAVPAELLTEATAFPGPLIRRIVHFLDAIALRPGQIHAYNAISGVVAARAGYFPPGVDVRVLHHPSSLPAECCERREHVFTVSRLDAAKRIDLLIDGFRRSATTRRFLIGGTGSEEAALRRRAAGDSRVAFLGFVDSARLTRLYAESAMVLFAPQDEDFGLVALEAMGCARPVITTHDAGGCTELIEHDTNGMVVAADAGAIGAAIDRLDADPDLARRMGEAARLRAAAITWPALVDALLGEPHMGAPALLSGRRPRITVLSTYAAANPKGGGALRIFHLHERLRRQADIDLLVFDSRAAARGRRLLGKGLTQTIIPAEHEYRAAEHALCAAADWVPISDAAFALLCNHAPGFRAEAARACAGSDAVVLEHPFLLPAVPAGATGLIYDAHNMEAALKHLLYPRSAGGRRLLDGVIQVEHEACQRAQEIWACSEDDRLMLASNYRVPVARILLVANGVDTRRIRFVSPSERAQRRTQYGLPGSAGLMAYFVGSWHGPNIEAACRIIACARYLPELCFVIAGSVGDALRQRRVALPANVVLSGVLDDAASLAMLTTCDIALNPMREGSGTNLKLFEYCAAGAPVVTTAVGARGSDLCNGAHLRIVADDCFEEGIIAMWAERLEGRDRRSRAARQHVEQHFDWEVIVARLLQQSAVLRGLFSAASAAAATQDLTAAAPGAAIAGAPAA